MVLFESSETKKNKQTNKRHWNLVKIKCNCAVNFLDEGIAYLIMLQKYQLKVISRVGVQCRAL